MKNNLIKYGLHFDCGNSSGVEHNLAKVGVASSNLVSRSIFFIFILLFSTKLFANEVSIYPMYCIVNDQISLRTFGFDGEDNEILNLEGMRAAKIDSKRLYEILTSNFKTYKDKSGGSVVFVKNCQMMDEIQMHFLKAISDEYPGISVSDLSISPQNKLPANFKDLVFKNIFLSDQNSQKGVFRASFEDIDLSLKSLYFKFSFSAKMPVFIAINSMNTNHILSLLDYQPTMIEFSKWPRDALSGLSAATLITKIQIKSGEILTKRQFNAISLVKKGEMLNAVLIEGGVNIIAEVKALEDGNLGDMIKIRTKDNKILEATVSGKGQAIIR
jgi:flagella basal body P-ring formation protein flgA